MAIEMRVDDEVRIKILEALLKKGAVVPSIRQIQRYTGLHKATIKSSLDFMGKHGLLEGFGPKVNFKKLGYNLDIRAFYQMDLSDKKVLNALTKAVEKDSNTYRLTAVIGAGNWNVMTSSFFRDIESYHQAIRDKYYDAIPGLYKAIKDRLIFYLTEPDYKNASRTKSIIELIKKEKGYS